tara:strand:+ start:221 stop:397 length:177 start_codon:yes stop_codon:yes gene_type:complete
MFKIKIIKISSLAHFKALAKPLFLIIAILLQIIRPNRLRQHKNDPRFFQLLSLVIWQP